MVHRIGGLGSHALDSSMESQDDEASPSPMRSPLRGVDIPPMVGQARGKWGQPHSSNADMHGSGGLIEEVAEWRHGVEAKRGVSMSTGAVP